jgi:hypothetical protein
LTGTLVLFYPIKKAPTSEEEGAVGELSDQL